MRYTSFECTASDWRFKMLCYADFNIYHSSWRKLLHICFEFHRISEYMRWTCFVSTAGDSLIKCFVTPTLTYTAQVDESVLHICFDFRYIIEYMRWTYFASTAGDSRFKTLSYPDFNIHRSSRRYCLTYLFWVSLDYWVYALYFNWVYC